MVKRRRGRGSPPLSLPSYGTDMTIKFKRKVVINRCYGGFCLSKQAWEFMLSDGYEPTKEELQQIEDMKKWRCDSFGYDVSRDNPHLIKAVETLGKSANAQVSNLKVIEVTVVIDFEDCDGMENVVVYGGENWD
jgi:hypothetical protein